MNAYTETVGSHLNSLLEKTYDAEKGYKTAAENTKNTNLKAFFQRKSEERKDFGHAIKAEIKLFGEEPEKGGSIQGNMHRAWMDTKAFFTTGNAEAMLEESIRGEKAAINEYEHVLKEATLPASTNSILSYQINTIKSDLKTVKRLEDLS